MEVSGLGRVGSVFRPTNKARKIHLVYVYWHIHPMPTANNIGSWYATKPSYARRSIWNLHWNAHMAGPWPSPPTSPYDDQCPRNPLRAPGSWVLLNARLPSSHRNKRGFQWFWLRWNDAQNLIKLPLNFWIDSFDFKSDWWLPLFSTIWFLCALLLRVLSLQIIYENTCSHGPLKPCCWLKFITSN